MKKIALKLWFIGLLALAASVSAPAQTLQLWLPLTNTVPGAGDTIPSNPNGGGMNIALTMYANATTPANLIGNAGSGITLLNPNQTALDLTADRVATQGTTQPGNGSGAGVGPVLQLLNNATLAANLGTAGVITNFMVTMWINSVANPTTGNDPRMFVLSPGATVTDYNNAAATGMQWDNATSMYWSLLGNTLTGTLPANYGSFPVNTWMFFAVTYDGAHLVMYYGTTNQPLVQIGSLAVANKTITLGAAASIDIGNSQAKSYDRAFNGWFSDIRFYNGVAGNTNQNLAFLQGVQYQQLLAPTPLPTIIAAPAAQTTYLGATATLTATMAPGTTNVSYQWQSGPVGGGAYTNIPNSGQFSGANTNALVIAGVNAANAADYVVVVSNSSGSVTSAPPATLTINPGAPTITTAPVSQVETPGWPASLTVAATGAVTYQWQSDAGQPGVYTNLLNGPGFSGVNTATLTINNFATNDAADYEVVVGNGGGAVVNDGLNGDAVPATLTLSTNLLYNSQFALPGTGKIVTGYATVPGWSDNIAATNYTDTGVQAQDGAIPDPNFTSTWEAYTEAGMGGPYQLSHYQIQSGDSFTLTWYAHYESTGAGFSEATVGLVTAATTNAAIGATITNAVTTNILTSGWVQYELTYDSTPADVGNYIGVYFGSLLTNGLAGGSWSGFNDFSLTVRGAGSAPVIVATTPNTAINGAPAELQGAAVNVSVTVLGTGLSYQWLSDAGQPGVFTNLLNGAGFTNVNTGTLTIENFTTADAADYEVVVSNSGGAATNNGVGNNLPVVTLAADTTAPAIQSLTPAGSPLPVPSFATSIPLTITVAASDTLTYQWLSDAGQPGVFTNLLNGAGFAGVNTPVLTISNAGPAAAADYKVVAASGAGSASSQVTLAGFTNLLFNGAFTWPGNGKHANGYVPVPGWTNTGAAYANSGVQPDTGAPGGSGYEAYLESGDAGGYQLTGYKIHQGDTFTLTWYATGSWNGTTGTFTGSGPVDPNQTVTLVSAGANPTPFTGTTTLAVQTNGLPGYNWVEYTLTYTASAADAGNYLGAAFVVHNNSGTTGSYGLLANFVLAVQSAGSPPQIVLTSPVTSPTAYLGSVVDLSVTASGSGLSYQWKSDAGQTGSYTNLINGANFSGVGTANLVISNVTAADAADYECVVANLAGAATNDGAGLDLAPITLAVNTSAPAIGTGPASQVATLGWPVTLPVVATGAVSYQWQAGAVGAGAYTNLLNGVQFSNVNTATLTINGFTSNNVADYVCVVRNGAGTAVNNGLNGAPAPATVTLSTNLLYNNQFALPGTGKIKTGYATVPGWSDTGLAANYTDTGVQAYGGAITDPYFSSTWEGYTEAGQGGGYQISHYQIHYGDSFAFTWWAQAESTGAGAEQQIVGLALAASNSAPFGAVNPVTVTTNQLAGGYTQYTLVYNSRPADAGQYLGVFFYTTLTTGLGGTSWSGFNDFYLTVAGAGAPPNVAATSGNQSGYLGSTVNLSVTAGGTGLGYQWQADGGTGTFTNILNGGQFAGATTATLVITNLQAGNAGNYQCVVTNAGGVAVNDGVGNDLPPIVLSVNPALPTINAESPAISPNAEYPGFPVTLSVTTAGAVTYQWLSDAGGTYAPVSNVNEFSGATSPTLVISSFAARDAADYKVVVSNGAGSVTNDGLNGDFAPITLTLNPNPPTMVSSPASQAETLTWPAVLAVQAVGAVTYQWYSDVGHPRVYAPLVNGPGLSGATTATLVISNFSGSYAADYEIVLANGAGSVTNDGVGADASPATLTVSPNLLYNPGFELPDTVKISTGFATVPGWANTAAGVYGDSGVQNNSGEHSGLWEGYLDSQAPGGAYQVSYYPIHTGDTFTLTWWSQGEWNGTTSTYPSTDPGAPLETVALLGAGTDPAAYGVTTDLAVTNVSVPGSLYTQFTLTYASQPADAGKYVGVALFVGRNDGSTTINSYAGFDDISLLVQSAAPASVPTPALQFTGGNLVITLPTGILLQATNLAGPWTTNSGSSPYTVTPTNSAMFFRSELP